MKTREQRRILAQRQARKEGYQIERVFNTRTNRYNKQLHCLTCGKVSSKQCNMKDHCRSHVNQRKVTCDRCGKVFKLRSSLKRHARKCLRHRRKH